MKKQIQQTDLELFRQAVAEAERLDHGLVEPFRPRPPPVPRPRPELPPAADGRALLAECEVETGDYLLFARPGIQQRLLGELRRGAIEPGLTMDLHGLSADHARQLLAEFLAECGRRRLRCAHIVHGKGYGSSGQQPVLKRKLNYWLRLYEQVLAFCSATRRDGGTGAVYVLLRNPDKRRPER